MSKPIDLFTIRRLENHAFVDDPFIVGNGFLTQNGLVFIGGPPKSYKSFTLNTLVVNLATAMPLFNAFSLHANTRQSTFPVAAPQKVLLFEQEVGLRDLWVRFREILQILPDDAQNLLRDNLTINSLDHECQFDTELGLARIRQIIERVQPQVVCFDPLVEFHTSEENSSAEMSDILRKIDALREDYLFGTIITHHTGKPDPNSTREGPDLLRGSSTIFGKGDTFMMLRTVNRSAAIVEASFVLRRARPPLPLLLKLDPSNLTMNFYESSTKKSRKSAEAIGEFEDLETASKKVQ